MPRKVDEWIGRTPDTPLPTSVYLRLYRKQDGRCPACTRKLRAGNITREHVRPLSMGGENRESNIELWCSVPCSKGKTIDEAPPRAKADRVAAKTVVPKRKEKRRGFRGWRKFNGDLVWRD